MKEAKRGPANRCFKGNCPRNPEQQKEERIKEILSTVAERKRANRLISELLKLSKGSLVKLLPAVERRYPKIVLAVLIERIERNQWDRLSPEDQNFVRQTKASLGKRAN